MKISGAGLVTSRISGGYLTTPRWGKGIRRGKIFGEVVNVYSAQQIKELLMDLFDKYIPDSFYKCENSTSSITISKVNPTESKKEFTYDVVILKDVDSIPQILRVVKQGNSLMYQWNKLPEMKHFIERFKLIQGPQMWADLRERYYQKKMDKINGVKYHDKKSFQIFHDAVNETLQKFQI